MADLIGLYPSWYVPQIGTAWVMGIIGTIHVLASNTSVGAALLFALLETRAVRDNKPEIMQYIKKYGMFLLVFSYIWGSVTGPGIWYSITVASPRGVSALIHNFVLAWAAEWVFFTVEVIGVYALVYTIGKIDPRTHLKITWTFAISSVATMVIIVGILSFMMWPGSERWYFTGSVFDAFFNLNFFAQLFERLFLMLTSAAIVGSIIVAAIPRGNAMRAEVGRTTALLGIAGLIGGALAFMWYVNTLPPNAMVILRDRLPDWFGHLDVRVTTLIPLAFTSLLVGAYLTWIYLRPHQVRVPVAAAMVVILLVAGIWPEERTRETLRKPWVAGQYVYSNQIIGRDVPGLGIQSQLPLMAKDGLLKTATFVPDDLRTITPQNTLAAGRLLAVQACANCHSLDPDGALRPLPKLLQGTTDVALIQGFLAGPLYHGSVPYMPRIPLPEPEQKALATYLAAVNAGRIDAEGRPLAAPVTARLAAPAAATSIAVAKE
jgi:Cytochrome bd-type quinol oxidase, subunit 1